MKLIILGSERVKLLPRNLLVIPYLPATQVYFIVYFLSCHTMLQIDSSTIRSDEWPTLEIVFLRVLHFPDQLSFDHPLLYRYVDAVNELVIYGFQCNQPFCKNRGNESISGRHSTRHLESSRTTKRKEGQKSSTHVAQLSRSMLPKKVGMMGNAERGMGMENEVCRTENGGWGIGNWGWRMESRK